MSNTYENLTSAAMKIMEQAEAAAGEYAIPVTPELADFMGFSDSDDVAGHEED